MASIGELTGQLELNAGGFNSAIDKAQGKLGDTGKSFDEASTHGGGFNKMLGFIGTTIATNVGTALTALETKLVQFGKESIDAATEYQRSMTTLDIISGRFGISADKAKQAATDLGKELRIGVGPAADALQNLFKSGLNLDQAQDLLRRFTNEAITGKSSSISLAQAVQNLSFAYNTGNSALGNMSGVSENFNDIVERGAKLMGKKTASMTDAELAQAKYKGMVDLTNLTLGSSEKFTGTLIDTQAELDQNMDQLKTTIGSGLAPVMNNLLKVIIPLTTKVGDFIKSFDIGNIASKLGTVKDAVTELFQELFLGQNVELGPLQDLVGDDMMWRLDDFARTTNTKVVEAIGNLGDKIQNVLPVIAQIFEENISVIQNVLEIVIPVIQKIGEVIIESIGMAIDFIISNLPKIIPVIQTVNDVFVAIFNAIANIITNVVIPVFQYLRDKVFELVQFFIDHWSSIAPIVENVKDIIVGVVNIIVATFQFLWPVIKFVVDVIINALKLIFPVLAGLLQGVTGFVKGAVDVFGNIGNAAKNVYTSIADWFGKAFGVVGDIVGKIKDIGTGIFDGVLNGLKAGLNGVIDMINKAIGFINDKLLDSINHIPGVSVGHLGNIPKLANGADFITNGPQLVMVGDNPGGQERVQVTPQSSPNVSGPQSGREVTINNYFPANMDYQTIIDKQVFQFKRL